MKKIKADISTILILILSVCALVAGCSALFSNADNDIPVPPSGIEHAQTTSATTAPGLKSMAKDMPLSPVIPAAAAFYQRKQFKTLAGHVLNYYWMSPPKNILPIGRSTYPLVVVLHDASGRAYAADYLASEAMRGDFPSFVAVPVIRAPDIWAHPNSKNARLERLGDIEELIGDLMLYHMIDRDRIYIIGCSMGGIGAFGAIARYPDIFAAGIAISGEWDQIDAPIMVNTPLLVIHGEQDKSIPIGKVQALVNDIRDNGGERIMYREVKSMPHSCSAPILYSKLVWHWLYTQHK